MTRTVFCSRYKEELEGLEAPPFPGAAGDAIMERVSKRAWEEWLRLQTMLINERRLVMTDARSRSLLAGLRERFLQGEEVATAEGYVPPESAAAKKGK